MNRRHIEPLLQDAFINMKFFATVSDFDIVSVIFPSRNVLLDANGLRIRCLSTGKIAGRVVDQESPFWERMKNYHPPGFRLVQAKLSEFAEHWRDDAIVPYTNSDIRLELVDQFGIPVMADAVFTWHAKKTLPLPSRENIVRIAGDVGHVGFLFGGSTWFGRLQALTRRYYGRDIESLNNVLDWGVGCARIGRHLLERGFPHLYGADIDQLNIDWLQSNLGWKNAVRVDFDPPMPFSDNFFDLVYGHSVFTHLSEQDQDRWLKELHRVLRPGGFAFVTTCGEGGVYHTRYRDILNRPHVVEAFLETGFYDFESQSSVGVDVGREGYYRLVAHTRSYVMHHWSKFFAVRRILPCFMDHQDLVVLQKI